MFETNGIRLGGGGGGGGQATYKINVLDKRDQGDEAKCFKDQSAIYKH